VLRLAAIGYYTVDYLRSFADDYVNYVYDRVNRVMGRGAEMRAGGIQLNRDEIRESVQASFTFLSFDEYPRTVFDLESTRAYYWKLDTGSGKSVAHEIYLELCRLRAATLESFELATRHLIFLRETSRPDAACSCLEDTEWMKDTLLPSALRLMEQAWRNFRIYNFLDAEAQMRTAADRLQIVVDSVR
jgi:hypothetical protein